jgi:azobenzene reductase
VAQTGAGPSVLLLGGSLAKPSHTSVLLAELERELAAQGAAVCRWDLGERTLPFADPVYHRRARSHRCAAVRELASAAGEAQALVLGSPVYHNSYSALLKNALDLLSIAEFAGKPVGLVSHASRTPGSQALDHLRLVARGLHAIAIPTQLTTIDADYTARDGLLHLSGAKVRERLGLLARELVWYAIRLCPTRTHMSSGTDHLEVRCALG